MPNLKRTMNNRFFYLIFIGLIIQITFQSCSSENENKIIGKYYIEKIGDSKTSLSYEINQNEPNHSFKKNLISAYVYEVQWNDNFILAKQHPEYEVQVEALNQIFHINRRKTMKEKELNNENEFYSDTLLVEKVRNTSKIEFEKRLENGDLKFINRTSNNKNAEENNITFYYLIDIKNSPKEPIAFFNKDSLNFHIDKLEVGKFKNKRILNKNKN